MTKPKESLLVIRGITAAEKRDVRRMARACGFRTMSAWARKLIHDAIYETPKRKEEEKNAG